MTNSVEVCSGSTLFVSILNSPVMLGNYLQQTTAADDIFRCIFSWRLRVKKSVRTMIIQQLLSHYGLGVDDEPLAVYTRLILLRRCMMDAHGPG